MAYFIHLGQSRATPKMILPHTIQPVSYGNGYAGAKKKDIGSMKSISGEGAKRNKKIAPLRFKM